jgi:hypothetical protein
VDREFHACERQADRKNRETQAEIDAEKSVSEKPEYDRWHACEDFQAEPHKSCKRAFLTAEFRKQHGSGQSERYRDGNLDEQNPAG